MKGSEGCFEVLADLSSGLPLSLLKRDSGLSVVITFISDACGNEMPPLSESGLGILGGVDFAPSEGV